ncbi:3-keto-5-aminohexanoate cleavage protein [Pseudomonadota bacterium]
MTDPIIVCVAPNGARRLKPDHAGLPLTAKELARDAAKCRDAGAAMVHLHVRDKAGGHLLDAEAYREATQAIRHEVGDGMLIQITTEAVGKYQPQQQIDVVKAVHPQCASLALRELIPNEAALDEAQAFFHWMANEGVLAQYILYTPEEVRQFNELRARGIIPGEMPLVLFVLGSYAGGPGRVSDLRAYLDTLNEGGPCHWAECAFGVTEAQAARWAMANGGHPRVGFENNLMLETGDVAPGNAALVAQTVEDGTSSGRTIADASMAWALFSGEKGASATNIKVVTRRRADEPSAPVRGHGGMSAPDLVTT